MTLKNRIYLIFSVAGIFLMLMAWSSHSYVKQLQGSFSEFSKKSIPVFKDIQDLRFHSLQLLNTSLHFPEHDVGSRQESLEIFKQQHSQVISTMQHYQAAIDRNFPDEKKYALNIDRDLSLFLELAQASTTQQASSTSQHESLSKALLQSHIKLLESLNQAYQHENAELLAKEKETAMALANMTAFNALRLLLGLVILAVLAYFSQKLLSGAISRMLASASYLMSDTPPPARHIKTKDELNVFENRFYETAEKLQAYNHEQRRLNAELKDQIEEKELALKSVREHEKILSLQVAERTKELELAKLRAEKASEAKTLFLANMSHEIRTPLNAVIGLTRVLQQQAVNNDMDELSRSHLERIHQGGEILLATVNTILDITKIEAGKMPLFEEEFSIEETLLGLCAIFEIQASQKDVHFEHQLEPSLHIRVRTDRSKFIQILNNLLSNAIKFTPAGGKVTLQGSLKKTLLTLVIKDTGVGIPNDRLKAVFDTFEQADASITRHHGGSGLGLTIARKLTDLLRGQISVASTVGVGSEFTVRMPLEFIAPTRALPQSSAIFDDVSWGDTNIMVVEDNEVNQAVIEAMLRSFGANVVVASSGFQAIELLKQQTPHLVLMDLHMPGMSGIETTRLILSEPHWHKLPIIALSADALIDQQSNASAAGMVDYLIKPVDLSKLRYTVRKYLLQQKVLA